MGEESLRKALGDVPLLQQERDALTADELFVLVLAGKLEDLTASERLRLPAADVRRLAAAGRILDLSTSPGGGRRAADDAAARLWDLL